MLRNKQISQVISPMLFNFVTGTWTNIGGQVSGTIAKHVAATDETCIVTIPIIVPSSNHINSGAKVTSIEIEYEVLIAACDAFTAVINKVTRGADLAVAVLATTPPPFTQTPTVAVADDVDQHKLTLTITTPFFLLNTEYLLVELTVNKAATTTVDFLSATVNYQWSQ
jgi:hypothetical protein